MLEIPEVQTLEGQLFGNFWNFDRFIRKQTIFDRIVGEVTNIDKKNFEVTLKDKNGEIVTASVETSTQMQSVELEGKTAKVGFGRIEVGQKLFIVGMKDENNVKKYASLRLIIVPSPSPTKAPTITPKPTISQ